MPLITLVESELRAKLTYSDGLTAATTAFTAISNGDVIMPPIQQLAFPHVNGSTCVKSAGIMGSQHFTVKMASGFYDNMKKTGGEIPNGRFVTVRSVIRRRQSHRSCFVGILHQKSVPP